MALLRRINMKAINPIEDLEKLYGDKYDYSKSVYLRL